VIRAVLIVVPAHDEEQLLPPCLAALQRAAEHPSLARIPVRIAVVLDRCSDRSGDLAAPLLRTTDLLLEQRDGNVGVARRSGARALFAAESGRPGSAVWIATTDADSRVPPDWLTRQVALADAGADAVAGTIAVDDWHEQPRGTSDRFLAHYASGLRPAAHGHVHGANLGVRGSTYEEVGGLSGLPLAEDHALVDALEAHGARVVRPPSLRVVTSGRRESRASGGFSDHLRALSARGGCRSTGLRRGRPG
jgi:cellulose synthase/poly-beta-1,6-N-acetylglucosamine synthase-like glycosyltransferase